MGVKVTVGLGVPAPGVTGVLVGGRVGVAVIIFTGITNNWPTKRALGSVSLFSSMIASSVLLNFAAITPSESPA